MSILQNKIVFITGASSGIGLACARYFAGEGSRLILAARRIERVRELTNQLKAQYNCEVLPLCLDVQDKNQVAQAIRALPKEWENINVLINNAGLALSSNTIQEGNVQDWDTMIDTNIKGLLYVTHAVLPLIRKQQHAHIINIGSIAGHEVYPRGNVYCATKFAVNAISKSLRIDLLGSGIRVTEIAPGAVNTEFSTVRWSDKEKADQYYENFTPLTADDIADAVLYCASRPLHVDIAEMVVTPTAQASANHLYREGGM